MLVHVTQADIDKALAHKKAIGTISIKCYCPIEYATMRTFKQVARTPNYHMLIVGNYNRVFKSNPSAQTFMRAYDQGYDVKPETFEFAEI